jgi:hypothetical protein
VAHSPKAQSKHAATTRRNAQAVEAWSLSDARQLITAAEYQRRIQPRLRAVQTSVTAAATLNVPEGYAALIRMGKGTPHPGHWRLPAELTAGAIAATSTGSRGPLRDSLQALFDVRA